MQLYVNDVEDVMQIQTIIIIAISLSLFVDDYQEEPRTYRPKNVSTAQDAQFLFDHIFQAESEPLSGLLSVRVGLVSTLQKNK
jgi:hypothetical protein